MAGLAIITEACIDVKDRACVDVCPVQCIYEFDPQQNVLFSEDEAGSGTIETTHAADPDAIAVFGDSILYVNLEESTSCTACYQPDVCPVGAIYSEEHLPDASATSAKYNTDDHNKGHDHTFHAAQPRRVRRLGSTRRERTRLAGARHRGVWREPAPPRRQ
jgi:formate hydrogenlyase subunit 6/NADH:ubiquinone oxidoreductase subunit I